MAKIGMTNAMISLIAEDENTASHKGSIKYYADHSIDYSSALAMVTFEHARRANVTYNRADGQLWGDDVLAEKWTYLVDADIELELTELERESARAPAGSGNLVGVEKIKQDTGATTLFTLRTLATGKLDAGFGFIQTLLVNGARKYRAVFFPRVTFHIESEETMTKEEAIQWGCPILRGKARRVLLADASDPTGYSEQIVDRSPDFDDLSVARLWLMEHCVTETKLIDMLGDTELGIPWWGKQLTVPAGLVEKNTNAVTVKFGQGGGPQSVNLSKENFFGTGKDDFRLIAGKSYTLAVTVSGNVPSSHSCKVTLKEYITSSATNHELSISGSGPFSLTFTAGEEATAALIPCVLNLSYTPSSGYATRTLTITIKESDS